jgi:hypothetical protein
MAADRVPASLVPIVRRFSRRLRIGLFLEAWPQWAAGALLGAGCAALVCRLFFPPPTPISIGFSPHQRWRSCRGCHFHSGVHTGPTRFWRSSTR